MFRDWKSESVETYAESLWFLMQPNFDPLAQAFAVTCFIDTSATDDGVLEHAVLGGVLMNRDGFLAMHDKWNAMLTQYKIDPPFHTHELCPAGKLAHIVGTERRNLLTDVASLINDHKIHTLAVCINNRQHEGILSYEYRQTMRVYPTTFIMAASANSRVAQLFGYQDRIAYVLDAGTKHVGQVIGAHRALRRVNMCQLGPLAIDDDALVPALQASDVVAWVRRRIESGSHLPKDFEPLLKVFGKNHVEAPVEAETLIELNEKSNRYGIHGLWPLESE